MRRVLAFFGAFNPPTVAHVEAARFALEQTGREGVIFVPSKCKYIRDEQGKDFAFSDGQRLEMLRRAAGSRPWMALTDWELTQPEQPRTYVTLCHLRDEGFEPALLMGSDKLPELEHIWLHVGEIAREFGIVCMARGADACAAMIEKDAYLRTLSPYIQLVEPPEALRGVSSTGVRQRMAQIIALREEIASMVPREILPMLDGRENIDKGRNR